MMRNKEPAGCPSCVITECRGNACLVARAMIEAMSEEERLPKNLGLSTLMSAMMSAVARIDFSSTLFRIGLLTFPCEAFLQSVLIEDRDLLFYGRYWVSAALTICAIHK